MTTGAKSVTTPVTERGVKTRNAVLRAAEEVFGELGFDGASISEITRRAGVAQGTFYVYFPDKRAVFVELVQFLNMTMRAAIAKELAGVTDRMEMERMGLRAFFEHIKHHRALYKVVREAEFVDPEAYAWHYETLGAGYRAGIQDAIDAGQLSEELDAETAADILMGASEFLGWKYCINGDGGPTDEQFEHLMGFISRGLMYQGDQT